MIGNGLPERIVAKLLMIVEILVAASDGEDSLSQKSPLRMQDEGGLAWIGNNTIEGIDESELLIDLSEQQRPASEVMDPPAKSAVRLRRSRLVNGTGVSLHCVIAKAPGQVEWKCANSLLYQTLSHRAIPTSVKTMKYPG